MISVKISVSWIAENCRKKENKGALRKKPNNEKRGRRNEEERFSARKEEKKNALREKDWKKTAKQNFLIRVFFFGCLNGERIQLCHT